MRTFLSQDATAKWSLMGENARSETLSSGGWLSGISFDKSPSVLEELEDAVPPEPRAPKTDMVRDAVRCGMVHVLWRGVKVACRELITQGATR